MIYLLDTNGISAIMREDARMASWLSSVSPDDRVVTRTIARGEILFGLARAHPESRFLYCYRPHRLLKSLAERHPWNARRRLLRKRCERRERACAERDDNSTT